jgi:hypothetical protein
MALKSYQLSGSILGPLLFNIYFNDVFYFTHQCDLFNYADDNVTSVASSDVSFIEKTLNQELQVLNSWFNSNSFKANPSKFQAMLIKPKPAPTALCLSVNGSKIENAPDIKVLGVEIDSNLNFRKHIASVCKKANRQVNVLQRFHKFLDSKSRIIIYNSFIYSNFKYCNMIWMFANKKDIMKLEDTQLRALRFVLKDFTSSKDEIIKNDDFLSLRLCNLRLLAIEVFKCLHNLSPIYMTNIFKTKSTKYSFRSKKKLLQPKVKSTKYGIRSFRYYGAKLWNMLPNELKDITDLSYFKCKISTWSGPTCKCTVCTYFM